MITEMGPRIFTEKGPLDETYSDLELMAISEYLGRRNHQ
jgi:hypothetical protein